MMHKLLLSLAVLLLGFGLQAQQSKPSISFEEEIYDFGEVKEDGGTVTHTFTFSNEGGQPLIVHNVRASCGCTSPDWTRQPIQPGKKGFIKVTFDPRNRPGNFNKSAIVSTNGTEPTKVLRITGKVLPKEKTLEDIYPREMGPIRLKTSHLSLTRIAPEEVKTEELEFINSSDSEVAIDFEGVPSHLNVSVDPEVVAPGKKGVITAVYDAGVKSDWGFVVDQIYLKINGESNRRNRLSVSATIEEDFSAWTDEQIANAPVLDVDNRVFDFGELKQGEKVSHNFVITNSGKSNLVLRKVRASCGCTAIQPDKMVIAPGESTNVVAEFNSRGMSGRQNKSVTIYSNDPKKSTMLLRLTGTVVK
ncbi:uncharacterized protein DUF1573 [Marinilabilia salmonicolor]|jgi:hypothetical protein|uniref:Uncharacterized protein DUF1573 n=2 Tax=Marinilabilia salmonicolor TaxID=989 RepID=A0A2T0XDF6_9BACT|nr:uncharacterized protein DUF1573 [Marinilabilia salmonicolor]RCW36658.1 uncharacterized protein DUF1573 [Marinilabilia salmonicolor]